MTAGGAFEVDEAALETFATSLRGLGGDATTASGYADSHLTVRFWDAMVFVTAHRGVIEMRDAVIASLEQLQRLVEASAGELDRTAASYRATDDDARSALDATYPR